MTAILPTSTRETDRIELLVELAVVLPAQKAIAAVGKVRALFQLLQDFAWETAITSVEGVLALGAFNLLVSFTLAMWVAPAVRYANFMLGLAVLMALTARYRGAARAFVFGPRACSVPAASLPRGIP